MGQQVNVSCDNGLAMVEVSDTGPGFHKEESSRWDKHLGLVGMRERVESLGGTFLVESAPGQGTKVMARLSLQGVEEHEEE
jgi:signal transduction histidine kinase